MFYYVNSGLELITLTTQEFISEFLGKATTPKGIEPNHFYDPQTKLVYAWHSGKCVATSEYEYTPQEAEALLVELALENASNNGDGSIMFQPSSTKEALIADMSDYLENCIDDESEHDLELAAKIKQIIDSLKTSD